MRFTCAYLYRQIVLWLLLCSAFAQVQGQSSKRDSYRQNFNQVYSSTAIHADIEHFYTALNAAHPDLYRYISQQQLDSLVDGLRSKAGQLTLRQFYNGLSEIGSFIGCGHLLLDYPKTQEKYFGKYAYYPPLHLEIHDSSAVVKKNLLSPGTFEDAIVLSINGVPMDTLVQEINRYLTHDGYNTASNYWMLKEGWFNEFFIRYWPDSSTYTYELDMYKDGKWTTLDTTLRGFDYKTMKLPRTKRQKTPPQLIFKHDEKTNSVILTIKTLDPVAISRGKQKFHKFIRESFWQIQQIEPDQLIIDLRDNEGGNSFYPELLIAFLNDQPFRLYRNMEIRYRSIDKELLSLKGRKAYRRMEKRSSPGKNGNLEFRTFTERFVTNYPYNYQGTVYVMVNGGTYSAASELACYLKEHVAAVVVGSETGGSCDRITAGMYGIATLPNTGIVVHIPLITFEKDITQPREIGCGLRPDIPQQFYPHTSVDDPEMQHLLKVIEEQKQGVYDPMH